jgi:hypothetical protein
MIVATHGILASYIGIDSDAQAFITATGITDNTQKTAINTLVLDLKSYGIWTKMKALYPFIGGTATTHKYNLKDPRDLDVAFRLQFVNGWTHTSTGAKPNGTDAYAKTYLIPSTTFGLNNPILHMSKYQRENLIIGSAFWLEGVYSGVGPNFNIASLKYLQYSFSSLYQGSSSVAIGNFPDSNSDPNQILYGFSNNTQGYFVFTRTTNTSLKAFRNNSLAGSLTIDITNNAQIPETEFLYGARNDSWANQFNPYGFNPIENSFSSIGEGLTDAEASNFYTAVQKFQTTLGRQI